MFGYVLKVNYSFLEVIFGCMVKYTLQYLRDKGQAVLENNDYDEFDTDVMKGDTTVRYISWENKYVCFGLLQCLKRSSCIIANVTLVTV